ncbi:MAG: DUF4339 domain-containing protein [Methylovirgula sp.]
MSERSWFIASDGKQEGPFPEGQLSALIAAGRLTKDTLVWTDGMSGWQRAADIPGFGFSVPPPPPRSPPLPGGPPRRDSLQGGQLSADFGVWGLLWRSLVLVLAILLVIPAPWAFTNFYRWGVAHIQVPQRPNLAFTGKVGDIWWVFVLLGLSAWLSAWFNGHAQFKDIWYLPYLLIPIQAFLSWMTIRWVVANISSEGRQLPLSFAGSVWAYIGWNILLNLSVFTIIGWAWVTTAWTRWLCRNIEGTTRTVSFNASGWQVLWRTVVLFLTCIFIIPIPWMMNWYARWFISQFSVDETKA